MQRLIEALTASPIRLDDAYIFGSLVRPGDFYDSSDVDVAVHAVLPRNYFDLKCHLEERIGRDVDLVEIESCRFFDSIRRHGYLWTRQRS